MSVMQTDLLMEQFPVGTRIQVAPHLDCWWRGDRFGTVEAWGSVYLKVRMDRSGKRRDVAPENATWLQDPFINHDVAAEDPLEDLFLDGFGEEWL